MKDKAAERLKELDVRILLDLRGAVTGNQVREALRTYANQNADLQYEERVSPTNEDALTIGLSSESPQKHLISYTGEQMHERQVRPEESYRHIGIGYFEWPVEVNAIWFGKELVREKLELVKPELERLLNQ